MGQGKAFGIEHGVVGHLVLLHLIFFSSFSGGHVFSVVNTFFVLMT